MNSSTKTENINQSEKPPSAEITDFTKILLHQHKTIVSIYKHNLDLVLKVNIFSYAVTGAILSFYLSKPNDGIFKYSLIFPCLMNLGYSLFFFYTSSKVWHFDKDMKAIVQALGLYSFPDIMILKKALQICLVVSGYSYWIVCNSNFEIDF